MPTIHIMEGRASHKSKESQNIWAPKSKVIGSSLIRNQNDTKLGQSEIR